MLVKDGILLADPNKHVSTHVLCLLGREGIYHGEIFMSCQYPLSPIIWCYNLSPHIVQMRCSSCNAILFQQQGLTMWALLWACAAQRLACWPKAGASMMEFHQCLFLHICDDMKIVCTPRVIRLHRDIMFKTYGITSITSQQTKHMGLHVFILSASKY